MTPSNAYTVDVLDTLSSLAIIAVFISPVICGFLIVEMYDYYARESTRVVLKKLIALCVILFVLSLAAVILIPSKETLILIYGGK
ncbi:TPA: hypothetical protein R4340_000352 [Pasteurella multocida]|nr:hypothetical protein [Pasteurella multocida]